jgi:hypothetical protein
LVAQFKFDARRLPGCPGRVGRDPSIVAGPDEFQEFGEDPMPGVEAHRVQVQAGEQSAGNVGEQVLGAR